MTLAAEQVSTGENNGSAHRAVGRWRAAYKGAGFRYSVLYTLRWFVQHFVDRLDRRLVAIEQRRSFVEPWSIAAQHFTVHENKRLWNTYDWSRAGEEWTPSDAWKEQVLNEFLRPHMPEGGSLLEIGPGGGRWTEHLQRRARELYVVDISERALELCRKRFESCHNIQYLLGEGHALAAPDSSIDGLWSYDVFVHINPLDARGYFQEIARVLKPGAKAVIHHPGTPQPGQAQRPGWRSDLTDRLVLEFAGNNGMEVVSQTDKLVNAGDFLTVFRKQDSARISGA